MLEVREVCDVGNFICFKGEREKECLGMRLPASLGVAKILS